METIDLSGFISALEKQFDPDLNEFFDLLQKDSESGTVLKANEEDHFLLMVAYSPHRMPLRGADKRIDLASPRVLEKAAWRYMAKGAKGGINHEPGHEDSVVCVENTIHRGPDWREPDWPAGVVVKKGDWLVGFILDDATWAGHKAGLWGGVSMQGRAGRKVPTADTLARVRGEVA